MTCGGGAASRLHILSGTIVIHAAGRKYIPWLMPHASNTVKRTTVYDGKPERTLSPNETCLPSCRLDPSSRPFPALRDLLPGPCAWSFLPALLCVLWLSTTGQARRYCISFPYARFIDSNTRLLQRLPADVSSDHKPRKQCSNSPRRKLVQGDVHICASAVCISGDLPCSPVPYPSMEINRRSPPKKRAYCAGQPILRAPYVHSPASTTAAHTQIQPWEP